MAARRNNSASSLPDQAIAENIEQIDIVGVLDRFAGPFGLAAVERAVCDVRDGLSPVRRRILYGAAKHNFRGETRKCAQLVGVVMGEHHPHGDSSIYGALVNMAAPHSCRYPLLTPQGNFGGLDGDPAAAMRYTEACLGPLGEQIVRDLESRDAATVPWTRNYDDTMDEPDLLPSRFPVLLANGHTGIGYGYASVVLPHNLRELLDAAALLLDDPKAPVEKIAKVLPGPDFPGGAVIVENSDWHQIIEDGRGRIVVRAKIAIESDGKMTKLVVTEIPYGLQRGKHSDDKPGLQGQIVDRANDPAHKYSVESVVAEVRNESSDEFGTRLVIGLKPGVDPDRAALLLFRNTDLQTSYSVNQVVTEGLRGGVRSPALMGTRGILCAWIDHQMGVLTRRTKFYLARAKDQLEVSEAKILAHANVEDIIKTIKASSDNADIEVKLIAKYKVSPRQAQVIREMAVSTFARLSIDTLKSRIIDLRVEITEYERLLATREAMATLLKAEMRDIRSKLGDDRRTEMNLGGAEVALPTAEELVPDEPCRVIRFASGLVGRMAESAFKGVRGKAAAEALLTGADPAHAVLPANMRDRLWVITESGTLFAIRVRDLDELGGKSKGTNIARFVSLAKDDKVAWLVVAPTEMTGSLVIVTAQGKIYRGRASDFASVNSAGVKAIGLRPGDSVVSAFPITAGHVFAVTSDGYAVRFDIDIAGVPSQGRGSGGVDAVKVSAGERIVYAFPARAADEREIAVILTSGAGKRTPISADGFGPKGRSIRGVAVIGGTDIARGFRVAFAGPVKKAAGIALTTSSGRAVAVDVSAIPAAARDGAGKPVVRDLAKGETVSSGRVIPPLG
jgi:DNA gyrase subunit A